MAGKGSARPPAAGGGAGLWAAVSAVAGAVAAVVALITYLAPPNPREQAGPSPAVTTPAPPPSTPDPGLSSPSPPDPSPSPESFTPPSPEPDPTRTDPVDSPLPAPPPLGCGEAATALSAYRRDAGTTRAGQAAAAGQAYSDLMGAVLHAQGTVGTTISRLAAEFRELQFRLTGMTGGDPAQVIADINTDIAQLSRLCVSG